MGGMLLLATVVLPLLGALAATFGSARGSIALGSLSLLGAVALVVAVGLDGPVSATLGSPTVAGLFANSLVAVLLLLVCGVSVVVQAFARRYLRGHAEARRFFVATGLLTAATAAMVTAGTLIGLAVAWTAAGVSLCLLLGLFGHLPAAREGVRRTVWRFAIGDAALWTAVGIATVAWGNVDLRLLAAGDAELVAPSAALTAVACLLVVAAAGRSTLVPLQGWLPVTLAAPTPVSALLHAGVVNAGGILLIRLSPVFGASEIATYLAFTLGAATLVYGTSLMVTKTDVKGSLVYSTVGQMGFMVMTCGLGAYALAAFHLVAHGMYKATLFLGSGGAVQRHVSHGAAPPRLVRHGIGDTVIAIVAPAVGLIGAAALVHSHEGTGALLVFAGATGFWVTRSLLARQPGVLGRATAAVLVVVATAGYVGLLAAFSGFAAPSLTAAGDARVSIWLLVPVLVVLVGLDWLRSATPRGRVGELHRSAYVLAMTAADPGARLRTSRVNGTVARLSGRFEPRPEGSAP